MIRWWILELGDTELRKSWDINQELKGYLGMGYLEMGYGATYGTIMLGWTYCESSKWSPIKKDPYILWVRKGVHDWRRLVGFGLMKWWIRISYMGASQIIRSGTRSGTTPVPYPRSIPPFHTCLKDPFHTSVPYLWSIRYDVYIYNNYVFNYKYNCIYIYLNMCNLILHLHAHTWAHIHTWMHTCKNTFTMPKPCDCVGKSVPAALTAATYFVVWW